MNWMGGTQADRYRACIEGAVAAGVTVGVAAAIAVYVGIVD